MKFIVLFALALESTALSNTYDYPDSHQPTVDKLVGKYAHYDVVSYKEKIGPVTMKNIIVSYGLDEFSDNGSSLVLTNRFCFSEYITNLPFTTKVNDEFTKAIIPEPVEVMLSEDDGRIKVYRPRTPTTLGVQLNDLVNEALPTKSNDPRLIDADKDGKPGVTVKIKLFGRVDGEIYITRKEVFEYNMELQNDGSFYGSVIDNSEQSTVGAKPFYLKSQRNPRQDPDSSKSFIMLQPVEKDFSCDDLKENRDWMFPENPEV